MNEELKKQIEQCLKDYGENAYLMLEKEYNGSDYTVDREQINGNQELIEIIEDNYFSHFTLLRKESAALPFDLKRAKAGDIVEYKNWLGEWKDFDAQKEYWKNHTFTHSENLSALFRMKYPPKVKPTNPG